MNKKLIFSTFLMIVLVGGGIFITVNQLQKKQTVTSRAASGDIAANSPGLITDADFNSNGRVDIFDFNSFISVFGQTTNPGSSANVRVLNVKAFGAKGDGVTDDTAAIQRLIDHVGNQGRSMYLQIYFPNGEYVIDSINAVKRDGLVLKGETMNGVRLIPKQSSAKPVIDLTGSNGVVVENIAIWSMKSDGTAPDVIPNAGFLISPTTQTQDSNKVHFYNVSALGFFSRAAYFMIGVTDSSFINTTGQSWMDGASALVISGKNNVNGQPIASVSSSQQIIGPTGNSSANDVTFIQCEFHNLSRQTNGAAIAKTTSPATIIQDASLIRFIGGLQSGFGPSIVHLRGSNRELVFDAVQFYFEIGTYPENTILADAGMIYGISFRNIVAHAAAASEGSFYYGKAGHVVRGMAIEGDLSTSPGLADTVKLITLEPHPQSPATVLLTGSDIMAGGRAIQVGGSITHTLINTPGQVLVGEGATDGSTKI